jgi:hypothetical protein
MDMDLGMVVARNKAGSHQPSASLSQQNDSEVHNKAHPLVGYLCEVVDVHASIGPASILELSCNSWGRREALVLMDWMHGQVVFYLLGLCLRRHHHVCISQRRRLDNNSTVHISEDLTITVQSTYEAASLSRQSELQNCETRARLERIRCNIPLALYPYISAAVGARACCHFAKDELSAGYGFISFSNWRLLCCCAATAAYDGCASNRSVEVVGVPRLTWCPARRVP